MGYMSSPGASTKSDANQQCLLSAGVNINGQKLEHMYISLTAKKNVPCCSWDYYPGAMGL